MRPPHRIGLAKEFCDGRYGNIPKWGTALSHRQELGLRQPNKFNKTSWPWVIIGSRTT